MEDGIMNTSEDHKKSPAFAEPESIDLTHHTKTIYFVRHGVALHNVPDAKTGECRDKYYDPSFTDPSLTSYGMEQARDAAQKLGRVELDLVVTSPLSRCLQTTCLIIQEWISLSSRSSPPVACLEDVREAFGKHYPDKRSPKSSLQKAFPNINFDPVMPEEDISWKVDKRESYKDVKSRVDNVLQWISERNETSILVTSHGVWIECCLLTYFPSILDMGKKRVHNCDIFQMNMTTKRSLGKPSEFIITSASQL